MNDVVVTSRRIEEHPDRSAIRVDRIALASYTPSCAPTLGDVLDGTPGLNLRTYGGPGSIRTAAFRGMGPEHTLIMLEGLPVSGGQLGVVDLSLIPAEAFSGVEVARGGSSASFGSDAMGGAVNLFSDQPFAPARVGVGFSVGSFGTERLSITGSGTSGSMLALHGGLLSRRSRGNFPFTWSETGKEEVRENSDESSRTAFLSGYLTPDPAFSLRAHVIYTEANRGTPGPLFTPSTQGTARQDDRVLLSTFAGSGWLGAGLSFDVAGSFQYSYERYLDAASSWPADNHYRNLYFTLSPKVRYRPEEHLALNVGWEWRQNRSDGNALAVRSIRADQAVYARGEIGPEWENLCVSLFPALRYDRSSTGGNSLSPSLGVNILFAPGSGGMDPAFTVAARGSVGKDFRTPTVNELFYAGEGGRGNPDARPERSVHLEGGISVTSRLVGVEELHITMFRIATTDRIQWLPAESPFIWSPQNIESTVSKGLEIEGSTSLLEDMLTFRVNYVRADARRTSAVTPDDPLINNQLLYIPVESGGASAIVSIPIRDRVITKLHASVLDRYTGTVYTSADHSTQLSPRHILNVGMGLTVRLPFADSRCMFTVENVFNTAYQAMPDYPMPQRTFVFSVAVDRGF
jgi:iron complex outermembrane receptor protein